MSSDRTVQYAFVTASASGQTTVVAAQTNQRIVVLQCCVITGGADNVKFQTSTGNVDLTALFPLAANGGFVMPYSSVGWFQTGIGDALLFNQSSTISTAVQVVWCPNNS